MSVTEMGIGAVIGAFAHHILKKINEKKVSLIYYIHNASYFEVSIQPKQTVAGSPPPPVQKVPLYSYSLFIRNAGNMPAHNVEIQHIYLPQHIAVLPVTTNFATDRGKATIKIKLIRAKEGISISYLSEYILKYEDIFKTTVKSDEGYAKLVPVFLSKIYSKRIGLLVVALMLFGVLFIIYLLYKFMPYIGAFMEKISSII